MKKCLSLLMICFLLIPSASASTSTNELIAFRGLKWYSTKADVEEDLFAGGASTAGWGGSPEEIYRLSATNFRSTTMGSDRVDGGGYKGWYAGISAAGYNVSDTYACYMFPIVDGAIIHDDELAEFYFGWYTFDSSDFTDHQGIYDDLLVKLTSIYGESQIKPEKYWTFATWIDAQENMIRLLINADKNYVTLGYIAAGADSRLDALQNALDIEAAIAEAELREENKTNTDGL